MREVSCRFQSTMYVASYHGACNCWALELFDPEVKSIVVYLKRVELYFAANEIKVDKWVPVFLNVIGLENYSLLRSILSPQKPVEQPLKKLMDVLKEYYDFKKMVMAARLLFTSVSSSLGSPWTYTWQTTKVGSAL